MGAYSPDAMCVKCGGDDIAAPHPDRGDDT